MLFERGAFPESPQLETKKALMLLDFQHDFVDPTGNLYAENIQPFVSRLPDLVTSFRKKGTIVWSYTEYAGPRPIVSPDIGCPTILLKQFVRLLDEQNSSGYPTPSGDDGSTSQSEEADLALEPDAEAILAQTLPEGAQRCCLPRTTGALMVEPLASLVDQCSDIVVRKNDYSAFADMSLLFQLRTRMVTNLYICGSLSNVSVYATVLDAVRHGFSVTIIEDCLGYRDESCHVSAMRQMADSMGAEGIDYQELMDDLAGLLGEVIKENAFNTKFEVNLGRSHEREKQSSGPHTHQKDAEALGSRVNAQTPPHPSTYSHDSLEIKINRERSSTLESSPPRKRSTNDLDDEPEDYQPANYSPLSSYRRQSYDSHARPVSREKKPKIRVRRKDVSERSRPSPPQLPQTTETVPDKSTQLATDQNSTTASDLNPNRNLNVSRKMARKASQATLGPNDRIGDGTSSVVYDILSEAHAKRAFDSLRMQVQWQRMYHRSGEVPRLVAVQGDVTISPADRSKSYPIYRHPSDESPQLLPFDHTVDVLRRECEKHVGHPLNHVLIQHYRNSEDNISEHSDKTLDIMRNSSIVNLSLGAQRTMTLRTKKVDSIDTKPLHELGSKANGNRSATSSSQPASPAGAARVTQRIPLPHASLFILSTATNAKYLHSIRADKRPAVEKSEAELAFNRERISLTFRYIGTFITEAADGKQSIWGQGATSKTQEAAKQVLHPSVVADDGQHFDNGDVTGEADPDTGDAIRSVSSDTAKVVIKTKADEQAEAMLIGFGKENHENELFDWDGVYGAGFDVVNFITRPIENAGIPTEPVQPIASPPTSSNTTNTTPSIT